MNPPETRRADRGSARSSGQGNREGNPAGGPPRLARSRLPRGEIMKEGPLTVNGIIDDFRTNRLDASLARLHRLEREAANQREVAERLRIANEAAHAYDQVLADLENLRALLKRIAPKK